MTEFRSCLDELFGGWTGFPTLITIFENKGIKHLNLISLWELTIATGNKEGNNAKLVIRETVLPKIIKDLESKELFFEAEYKDEEDLIELLDLSNKNLLNANLDSWQKVLPLYPISPIN